MDLRHQEPLPRFALPHCKAVTALCPAQLDSTVRFDMHQTHQSVGQAMILGGGFRYCYFQPLQPGSYMFTTDYNNICQVKVQPLACKYLGVIETTDY